MKNNIFFTMCLILVTLVFAKSSAFAQPFPGTLYKKDKKKVQFENIFISDPQSRKYENYHVFINITEGPLTGSQTKILFSELRKVEIASLIWTYQSATKVLKPTFKLTKIDGTTLVGEAPAISGGFWGDGWSLIVSGNKYIMSVRDIQSIEFTNASSVTGVITDVDGIRVPFSEIEIFYERGQLPLAWDGISDKYITLDLVESKSEIPFTSIDKIQHVRVGQYRGPVTRYKDFAVTPYVNVTLKTGKKISGFLVGTWSHTYGSSGLVWKYTKKDARAWELGPHYYLAEFVNQIDFY